MKSALAGSLLGMTGMVGLTGSVESAAANEKKYVFKVGSWLNGLTAFDNAKEWRLDTVQLSFPFKTGGPNDFRDPEVCRKFVAKSEETGIVISSLALAEFNGNPLWLIDDAEERVSICIDAMVRLKTKVVLVPFFGKAILDSDEKFETTIARLKKMAPKAEKAGVTLAIESTLGADGHFRIMNGVNSPAVQVYYDPGNMIRRFGTTDKICSDIIALKGHLAETHAKDSGLLGTGKIDYVKILDTYRKVGYTGPLTLEGSVDKKLGFGPSQTRNADYLRSCK